MKCVDKKGHDFNFVGYVVVADHLQSSGNIEVPPGPNTTPLPYLKVPHHFAAKIEAWQCSRCGCIQLKPAVFTRILEGDEQNG